MINDLDETLKQLLVKKLPLDTAVVGISFEVPNREWAASQSKPMINLYLYDIRENHELRSYEWTVERNNNSATRKKAPLRVDLSYLVTVWTKDVGDEHRLLGNLIVVLCRYPVLPEDILQGALKGLAYPIHASAAQPDSLFKSPADFWTALDNQLKPSINYVVTLPIDLDITLTAPIVWTKAMEVKEMEKEEVEEIVQIGGVVHEKGKPEVVISDATVLAKEVGISAKTGSDGRYTIPKLPRGRYTFRVSRPGWAAKETKVVVPSDSYNIEL